MSAISCGDFETAEFTMILQRGKLCEELEGDRVEKQRTKILVQMLGNLNKIKLYPLY